MSAPEPVSALEGHLVLPAHGAEEIFLAERRTGVVAIAARRDQETRLDEALRTLLGLGLPKPGRSAIAGDCVALCVAPMTALVCGPHRRLASLQADIPRHVAAVIDQSGGFVFLRISGPKAAAVLAKGCRLDLHPSVFGPGQCARSIMAQTPVVLHQLDRTPAYDLIVPRTLARSFAEFMIRAAEATGVEISAPLAPEESRDSP